MVYSLFYEFPPSLHIPVLIWHMDFSGELWSVCSLQLDYSFTNNVLTTEWDDVDSLVPSAKESKPAPAVRFCCRPDE